MVGIVLNSIYRPFLGILLQGGKPGKNTLMAFILILINIFGNIILIPYFGIYGAAFVTACVYVLEGLFLRYFAIKYLNIRI